MHQVDQKGDRELYNMLHDRSSVLVDYSQYDQNDENIDLQSLQRVESVMTLSKYDSPVTTVLHEKGDKITPIYPACMHPGFVQQTYFAQFRELELNDPDQVLLIKH